MVRALHSRITIGMIRILICSASRRDHVFGYAQSGAVPA